MRNRCFVTKCIKGGAAPHHDLRAASERKNAFGHRLHSQMQRDFFGGILGLDLGRGLQQLVFRSHLTLCLTNTRRGADNDFRKFLKQFDRPDRFGDIGVHA